MELTTAINERRSIRKFTDHYVTDEELLQIMKAAQMAQSWANTQTWEFIIIRDKDIINKITEEYSEKNPARKCSLSASALIVGCSKINVAGFRGDEQRSRYPDWFMFDLGIAVQNLCLKAYEIGLGTVVVGSMNHDNIDKILELPAGVESVVVIPVGKPVEKKKPTPRKGIEEFVHKDKFGESYKF